MGTIRRSLAALATESVVMTTAWCQSSRRSGKVVTVGKGVALTNATCAWACNCDSNEDCKPGLSCFRRLGFTKVPGCFGDGARNAVATALREHLPRCLGTCQRR